jgi:anti-sigma B factor antagonist
MTEDPRPDDISLTVTAAEGGTWAIVSVRGEIDVSTAGSLETAVRSGLTSSGRVIIDLSGVRFMDSTGLNVLIRAQSSGADGTAGVLRLAAVPDRVSKLLRLTQLDSVFAVFPTVTAAEAAPLVAD